MAQEPTAGTQDATVVTGSVSSPGKAGPSTSPAKKSAAPVVGGDKATASPSILVSEHGRTTIADAVVSKIAGIATREVPGVYALGGSTARAVGAMRSRIPGSTVNVTQGISVEVGETQAAVDIQLVAKYGYPISELARGIRDNIISSLGEMTSLEVTEVNIEVQDVHLGDDDEDETPTREPRVQ